MCRAGYRHARPHVEPLDCLAGTILRDEIPDAAVNLVAAPPRLGEHQRSIFRVRVKHRHGVGVSNDFRGTVADDPLALRVPRDDQVVFVIRIQEHRHALDD